MTIYQLPDGDKYICNMCGFEQSEPLEVEIKSHTGVFKHLCGKCASDVGLVAARYRDRGKYDLLSAVHWHCKNRPDHMPEIVAIATEAAMHGANAQLQAERERGNDFEIIASISMHAKLFKSKAPVVLNLLEKHANRSALNWSSHIKALECKKDSES